MSVRVESLPTTERSGTNPWIVLVLVCIAQFMVVLDATVVNVALPSIEQSFDLSVSGLQWVVNSYTLVFGGFLLLGGRVADLVGRKRIFLIGIVVFTVASLLNGLAPSGGALIAFRALQGLGAAMISPAALSIITTTFADGALRTRALAVWGAIAAGGGAFGLLLGGILTDFLSWEWVFFVNVPVGIAAFFLSLRLVPESRAFLEHRHFDVAGAVSVTAGLMVLVFAIVKAPEHGWGSMHTLGLFALGIALLIAFVFIERRSPSPLVRLGIFRIRSLASANGVLLLVAGGLFAMFFFASLYVQQILGYSPLEAGLAFLPVTAGIVLGSGMSAQLIRRVGVKAVLVTGLIVAAAGLGLLTLIAPDGTYLANLVPGLVVMSVGLGLAFVPLTLVANTNIEEKDAGLASGLFNTSQQIGGALGLAILSTVAANTASNSLSGISDPTAAQTASALVDGYARAFAWGAVLVAIGAVIILLVLRRKDVEAIDTQQPLKAAG